MNRIKSTSLALAAVVSAMGLSSVYAASDNGTATATVITPIAIVAGTNLSFGAFAAGTGGTVVIDTAGSRTNTGAVVLSASDAGSAGTFDVSGQANATYAITLPSTDQTLSDGAAGTMVVNASSGGGGKDTWIHRA